MVCNLVKKSVCAPHHFSSNFSISMVPASAPVFFFKERFSSGRGSALDKLLHVEDGDTDQGHNIASNGTGVFNTG